MKILVEKLLDWQNRENKKPLVLFGARQVGKSYTMTEFGRKHYDNVVYFFFEGNRKLQDIFD